MSLHRTIGGWESKLKLQELVEDLNRVSTRETDNPDWTAEQVIHQILKDFDVHGPENPIVVDEKNFDPRDLKGKVEYKDSKEVGAQYHPAYMPPGSGGIIIVPDLKGKSPRDIAIAAHEAYHAMLDLKHKHHGREDVVNRLAARWLQDHYSGKFLHFALNAIRHSRNVYKGRKYDSTKKYLDQARQDHKQDWGYDPDY